VARLPRDVKVEIANDCRKIAGLNMDKTAELKAKIEAAEKEKTALLTQSRLLQDFVSLAKSSAKEQMLTAILQKTLELTAELTRPKPVVFFLPWIPNGLVRDCILTRGPTGERVPGPHGHRSGRRARRVGYAQPPDRAGH